MAAGFSNAELSVIRRLSTFNLKAWFCKNYLITFFHFWHGASLSIRMVPMHCKKYWFGWIVLKVIFKGWKGPIWLIFHLEAIFSKIILDNFFSILAWSFSKRVLKDCQKKGVFSRSEKGQIWVFCYFLASFSINSHNFSLFFCIQLLGDDIDQLSRDEFDWIFLCLCVHVYML